jgi:hypothetical protein
MAKNEKQDTMAQDSAPVDTLMNLAIRNGNTFHRIGRDGGMYPTVPAHDSVLKAVHLQADVLHGWTKHERHTSESVLLSDTDYLAALEAAKTGKTHAPANKRAAMAAKQGA